MDNRANTGSLCSAPTMSARLPARGEVDQWASSRCDETSGSTETYTGSLLVLVVASRDAPLTTVTSERASRVEYGSSCWLVDVVGQTTTTPRLDHETGRVVLRREESQLLAVLYSHCYQSISRVPRSNRI